MQLNNHKFSIIFFAIFFSVWFSPPVFASQEDYLKVDTGCPEGWGKIRVWKKNPQRVGHVSLQTNSSYISIWPNSNADDVAVKEGQMVSAPALSIVDYEEDLRLEDNSVPNWYLIKLENTIIDETWFELRSSFIPHSDKKFKIPGMTWFAPGNSELVREGQSGRHENCASVVLKALKTGGVDISDLEGWQKGSSVVANLGVAFHQMAAQNAPEFQRLTGAVTLFGAYQSVTKPDDISWLLEKTIGKRLELRFRKLIKEDKNLSLRATSNEDFPYVLDEILKAFPLLNYEISEDGIIRALKTLGTVEHDEISGCHMFEVPESIRVKARENRNKKQECVVS